MEMIKSKIIVVGGGPAGASCARALKQAGLETLILDKKRFPRPKVCAGWLPSGVFNTLRVNPKTYPHTLNRFNRINFHLCGIKFPVKTCQYAVRRYEFDEWMIQRAHVPVHTHKVREIIAQKGYYLIDNTYQCKYLVGAGGTHCPVYNAFFGRTEKRPATAMISAVETEYQCDIREDQCHIWYFEDRLPGYAWYLPKGNGWLNIGIGGKFLKLKNQGRTIMDHWHLFVKKLLNRSLIIEEPRSPKGHNYYLLQGNSAFQKDNLFVIGDAVGTATLDMGEGIHSAIKSGIMAADAMIKKKQFNGNILPKFSLPGVFRAKKG